MMGVCMPPVIPGGGYNAALFVGGEGDFLGNGSYGKVWRAFHKTYRTVAVKVCVLNGPKTTATKEFENEINHMWSTNDCPYIVRCHGYFTNFDLAGIVMEYMEYGTLFELLHHRPPIEIPIELKIRFAQNITMALDYLHNTRHDQRFIHGDIKTLNILLDRFLVAKISDFGGCRLRTVTENLNLGGRGRDLKPGERNVFTIQYAAPEVLLNPESELRAAGRCL
uniref:Protein kinase domain-containing protein n=1 Tax=Ciona intestinalis TaxID=7719 RepID=H2XT44_CIOIN